MNGREVRIQSAAGSPLPLYGSKRALLIDVVWSGIVAVQAKSLCRRIDAS